MAPPKNGLFHDSVFMSRAEENNLEGLVEEETPHVIFFELSLEINLMALRVVLTMTDFDLLNNHLHFLLSSPK